MTTSTNVLITGATRGLGHETARRLAGHGWTVWLGARDVATGRKAADEILEQQADADVRVVQLDVTDDASVGNAVDTIGGVSEHLDVLVNNAGVAGRFVSPEETTPADFFAVYGVNVVGPVRVTNAFLPLLRRSQLPRLVMVSSGMGSFGVTNNPDRLESKIAGLHYPSSKAALNMLAAMYSKTLTDIRVAAVDPGYTSTAFNNFTGTQTVTEGTDAIVRACAAEHLPATFIDRHGPVEW